MKYVLLLTLALLMISCVHKVTDYPPQPTVTQDYVTDEVYLTRVRLKDVNELRHYCPNFQELKYSCAVLRLEQLAEGRVYSVCTIYVLPPKDFNDVPKLAIQGHALDHCFGRRHDKFKPL